MQRNPPTDTDGGYQACEFIMESAVELGQFSKFLPDTADLPTTHEHFVETYQDASGRTIKLIGVRAKAVVEATPAAPAKVEGDGLNAMSDADLETEAGKLGIANYPKTASKGKRVHVIREARAKLAPPRDE